MKDFVFTFNSEISFSFNFPDFERASTLTSNCFNAASNFYKKRVNTLKN